MHPIEHLRYIARVSGADPTMVAREAAEAFASMAREEPASLVPACKRLIDRHPAVGPLWWLTARLLTADDPVQAAADAAEELDSDPTDQVLAAELPDGATILVVGWPDICAAGLRGRGDIEVLAVDGAGEAGPFVRRLHEAGNAATLVPDSGLGAAAAVSDLVLVEAHAAGPDAVLALSGCLAAAAVAAHSGLPVWAVTGVGRVLPPRLWDALVARLDASDEEPWDRSVQPVAASLLSSVVGPGGLVSVEEGLRAATCPASPELFRPSG